MAEVEAAFVERFGPYAGWAHNVLFISDLKSQEHNLPPALRPRESAGKKRGGENAGASGPVFYLLLSSLVFRLGVVREC